MSPPDILIIFDWDDTLLPTTILRDRTRATPWAAGTQSCLSLDGPEIDENTEKQFEVLATAAAATLNVASTLGTVCLITNGSSDWIQSSCQKYMPSLWPHIENLRRVSAKDMVQHSSRDPLQWKTHAFSRELSAHFLKLDKQAQKVAISIGDSLHERHALFHFYHTTSVSNVAIRSVKFIPLPGVHTLRAQHAALVMHLPTIVGLPFKCRCADFRYQFVADAGLQDQFAIEQLVAVAAHEEETGEILHQEDANLEPQPQPLPQIDQMVYDVIQQNLLAQQTDSDEDTPTRHSDSTDTLSTVGAMFNRALTKMLRGSTSKRSGDSTRSTTTPPTTPSFSMTPVSQRSVRLWVKLNSGNPFLVGYVCGFTFDADYYEPLPPQIQV